MRAYNRRMILNLIRQNGAQPKAEMARATGLSAQTVSVIVNELLKERLVRKEEKVRGYVGQPYTPISLNPGGALSIGLKIGRPSLELTLVNFIGGVEYYSSVQYDAPMRDDVIGHIEREFAKLFARTSDRQRQRIVGVGVAMPGQIGEWTEEIGLAPGDLDDWTGFDITGAIGSIANLPVEIFNDGTAACAAEMQVGDSLTQPCALYIFLGSFIGGGIVLNGRLYQGEQGNAGAIGSMPVFLSPERPGRHQLIDGASLRFLEKALHVEGITGHATIADAVSDPRHPFRVGEVGGVDRFEQVEESVEHKPGFWGL